MPTHAFVHRVISVLRGIVSGGILRGFLFATLVALQGTLPQVFAETAAEDYETVSGILGTVDMAEKKGTLTTDLGRKVPFQIPKPELFLNLSAGQRVTLKLDQQGRAMRVMDSAAPELPPPSAPR